MEPGDRVLSQGSGGRARKALLKVRQHIDRLIVAGLLHENVGEASPNGGESSMTTSGQDAAVAEEARVELGFDPAALRQRYREERDRRLRVDGNEQYVKVVGRFAHYLDDPYVAPGFEREPLTDEVEVVVIGGGFGGLLAGA